MNKQKIISFRVTGNENQLLEILSKREGLSPSEMVRQCLREAAASRHLLPVGLISLERMRGENG